MKKILLFLILICYQVNVFAFPNINSPYVYFYQLNREEVLYEKEAQKEIAIASLTKIMTASVALDLITDLDSTIVLTKDDFKGLKEANASTAGFSIGEIVSYRDLLYGLMLPSGADAALALSNHLVGSEKAFVQKMNEKAERLNLKHTNFMNATGLDTDGNYSNLEDLSVILIDALKNPEFQTIFTAKQYTTSNGKHKFRSTLEKTSTSYGIDTSYIKGSKTGYTYAAGLCLASIAEHDGENYLLITAGADYTKKTPYQVLDSDAIYRYYFENYEYKKVIQEGDLLTTIMDQNENPHSFFSNKEIELYLLKDSDITYQYRGHDLIDYDMKAGDKIGEYDILVNGEVIDTQEFYLEEAIEKDSSFEWVVITSISLLILFLMISIFFIIRKLKKRMKVK